MRNVSHLFAPKRKVKAATFLCNKYHVKGNKINIESTYYYKRNYILSTANRRLQKLYGRGPAKRHKMTLTGSVDKKMY